MHLSRNNFFKVLILFSRLIFHVIPVFYGNLQEQVFGLAEGFLLLYLLYDERRRPRRDAPAADWKGGSTRQPPVPPCLGEALRRVTIVNSK